MVWNNVESNQIALIRATYHVAKGECKADCICDGFDLRVWYAKQRIFHM